MSYLRITQAQATAIRGKYGSFAALDPIPLADSTDCILTDAVLTVPAFAPALAVLNAAPVYPQWATATTYSIGNTVEYQGKLWRCVQAHTSQLDWTPPVAPALWVIAHRDGFVPAWEAPSGSHDTYALDYLVTHSNRTWKSLTANNTYEPGVVGTWRDQSTPPMWVQPSGSIGLWQIDDIATHNGQTWRCTSANNSFAPGVFGWVLA